MGTNSDPLPPLGKMRHPTDFEAHFADCQRLKQCLEDPGRHNARRLREDARDFVLRLTQRRPADRMKHAQVREHKMMEALKLPAFDAPPATVEAWCLSNSPVTDPGGPWVVDDGTVSSVPSVRPGIAGPSAAGVRLAEGP